MRVFLLKFRNHTIPRYIQFFVFFQLLPGFILAQDTDYREVFLTLSGYILGQYLKQVMTDSFHILSDSLLTIYPTIWRCGIGDTEGVLKWVMNKL